MRDSVNNQSLKVMVGEKRGCHDGEERLELGSKKPKMWDFNSVFGSEERTEKEAVHPVVDAPTRALDLNADVFERQEMECDVESVKSGRSGRSGRFRLDLNAEDVSSYNPFYPYKNLENLKSRDDSECASSIGPMEEKDPMRVWKEMKQNGFLSSSHGGFRMPKPRVKKTKNDGIKKKMEIAKREQVDKFAKIAAPSGLLNGLNPGIINHVRNSKQVHSIIEALVRSEKLENRAVNKQGSQTKCRTKECSEMKSEPESLNRSVSMNSELTGGDGDSCIMEPRAFGGMSYPLHFNPDFGNDIVSMKLSSSTKIASGNTSSLSHEESANVTSVTSLSVKAANVASQWLELLNQDIKGRLAALRRSKKRVRAVIHTELPYLVSRDFSSSQENNPNIGTSEAHCTRWGALFNQMDNALSDEEKQLESSLNQVKDMQLQCERGLLKYNVISDLPQMVGSNSRLDNCDNLDRDLPVRAAAASIYSTCNFLLSMENLPCC